MGAYRVVVAEILKSRMAQARGFGADANTNPPSRSVLETEEAVRQVVGGGDDVAVDVAFDATGFQSTLDLCISSMKLGGARSSTWPSIRRRCR